MFEKNSEVINDDYINKYLIYCLIKNDRIEEAKLIYDLKKELGFKDKYFDNKINILFNYSSKTDDAISEDSILDFFLAHKTNPNFSFDPNEKTKKIIWKYLSSANLLTSFKEIEVTELEKFL